MTTQAQAALEKGAPGRAIELARRATQSDPSNAEHLLCLVLPALTLGIFGAAYYTRLVRDEMVTVLAEDHVRTARAKGVSRAGVVLWHGLRNAALPLHALVLIGG